MIGGIPSKGYYNNSQTTNPEPVKVQTKEEKLDSYFPLLVEYPKSGLKEIIDDPAEIISGIALRVLETNYYPRFYTILTYNSTNDTYSLSVKDTTLKQIKKTFENIVAVYEGAYYTLSEIVNNPDVKPVTMLEEKGSK